MSQDLKIDAICDHRIFFEQLTIYPDYKTLKIPRAISSRYVDLWVNGYKITQDNPKFGWAIYEDPTFIFTKRYKIVFNNKRKSVDDFYQVSYTVNSSQCPKCLGQNLINDISYSKLGKANMVQNEDKLLQEIKKGISTTLGSNPFHKWIGTEIYTLIGTKLYNVEYIKSKIIYEINNYLDKYLDVQLQQYNYQSVTDREAFLTILSIDVQPQSTTDLTYWVISVIFRNRSGEDFLYEKKVEVPSTSPYVIS